MKGISSRVPWVYLHGDPSDEDNLLGNKARTLKCVSGMQGIMTPRGVAVLPAFSAVLLQKCRDDIATALRSGAAYEEVADAVERVLLDDSSGLFDILSDWWNRLAEDAFTDRQTVFAVRSSGHPVVAGNQLMEDSGAISMAGQYTSLLDVAREDVPRAYVQCVASLFNRRSLHVFDVVNDLSYLDSTMTVLIQEMIHGDRSGVMMTVDPIEGSSDILGIEGGCGRCEQYVNGSAQGELFLVSKAHGIIATYEPSTLNCAHDGAESGRVPCIQDREALELSRVGQRIEEFFGAPQDIEFTLTQQGPFVLQSRPITVLNVTERKAE